MSAPSLSLPLGVRLGEFLLERLLSENASGLTYLATDTERGVQVIIREHLPTSLAGRQLETLEVIPHGESACRDDYARSLGRFLSEARRLSSLSHPGIARVTRAFTALGTAYAVSPFAEGETLDARQEKNEAPTEARLRAQLRHLLAALDCLHGSNMLHGDIRPEHILLPEEGEALFIGLPAAPESAEFAPGSDLCALGSCFCRLITGETAAETSPDRPLAGRADLRGQYSDALLSSLDKAMAARPEERWQSAQQWSAALEEEQLPIINIDLAPRTDDSAEPPPAEAADVDEVIIPLSHRPITPGTQVFLPGQNAEPLRCEMELSAREMAQGCIKSLSVQGRQLTILMPAGAEAGRPLWLPADKTQGLGDVQLALKQAAMPLPRQSGESWLDMCLDYRYGLNGRERDREKSAECARRGHEEGDLNCSYLLCQCYDEGLGVPRNHREVIKLTQHMDNRDFAPAHAFLAMACAEGCGVHFNREQASQHLNYLVAQLARPRSTVHQEVRFMALRAALSSAEKRDYALMEGFARERFKASRLPDRFSELARLLFRRREKRPEAEEELRSLIEQGCRAGDPGALVLRVLCKRHGLSLEGDDEEAEARALKAVQQDGDSSFLRFALLRAEECENLPRLVDDFWLSCRCGRSRLHRSDELACDMRLQKHPIAYALSVPDKQSEHELAAARESVQLLTPMPPILTLKNEGEEPLTSLRLRLCSGDAGNEKSFVLPEALAPGAEKHLMPLDHGVELGDMLYAAAYSDERYAEIRLREHVSDFQRDVAEAPPLRLWWEKGLFGGHVLRLSCTKGKMSRVVLRCGKAKTAPVTLDEAGPVVSISKREFSDNVRLGLHDTFIITCEQYPPVLCRLVAEHEEWAATQWLKKGGLASSLITREGQKA